MTGTESGETYFCLDEVNWNVFKKAKENSRGKDEGQMKSFRMPSLGKER